MRSCFLHALGLLLVVGCRTASVPSRALPPLDVAGEGEVLLYLQPLRAEAERLEFTVASVAALAADGTSLPLETVRTQVSSVGPPHQRLLARGRLPPGGYAGFLVATGRATLARGAERTDLLVAPAPAQIDAVFQIRSGEATVLWATLRARESVGTRYGFSPSLAIASAPAAVPDLLGYCTNSGTNDVTVFDRVRRQVVGTVPVGRAPRGVAMDALTARAFVAVPGDGDVEVIDVAEGRVVGRIRLDPSDAPWDVVLAEDGRVLVSANHGSGSASFLDPDGWVQRSRVQTRDLPAYIVADRSGKRAFVLGAGSSAITVLDLDYASVAATGPTESEPLAAAPNRAGDVLYVGLRGSPYVAALSLPALAPAGRIYVGAEAASVAVDARTDRVYVAHADRGRIAVFDPAGFVPLGVVDLPAPASRMVVLAAEHVILALMPSDRSVAAVDLTSGRVVSVFDVGGEPHDIAVSGVRR